MPIWKMDVYAATREKVQKVKKMKCETLREERGYFHKYFSQKKEPTRVKIG